LGGLLAVMSFAVYQSSTDAGRRSMLVFLSRFKYGDDRAVPPAPAVPTTAPASEARRSEQQRLRHRLESLNREMAAVDADTRRLTTLLDASHLSLGWDDNATTTTTAALRATANPTPPDPAQQELFAQTLAAVQADDVRYRALISQYESQLRGGRASGAVGAVALEYDSSHVQQPSTRAPLIFAITSGRTGTKFFSQLFSSAKNVLCFHELHPLMSHDYLRAPLWETYHERMSVKAAAIAGRIGDRNWPPQTSFCDTSNYFIKSWWDVAIDRFAADYPIIVVIVRRHLAQVLKSMVDLGWFGGKGKVVGKFLYTANSNNSFVQPLLADEEMDHYDKALTHLFDVEAKAQFFKRRFARHPNIRIHEICLEQVSHSVDAAKRFLRSLGLEPTSRTEAAVTSGETNARVDKKPVTSNITYAQERIDRFVAMYKHRGLWLPSAPQIQESFCASSAPEQQQ